MTEFVGTMIYIGAAGFWGLFFGYLALVALGCPPRITFDKPTWGGVLKQPLPKDQCQRVDEVA